MRSKSGKCGKKSEIDVFEIFGLRSDFKLNQPQGEKKDLSGKMVKMGCTFGDGRVHIWGR